MKKLYFVLLVMLLLVPVYVSAEPSNESSTADGEVVAETVKYYKTYYDLLGVDDTYSVEITEEEFNSVNPNITPRDNTVETTYKKLGAAISKNGSYYRYRGLLEWKRIPSTRSYDIIGVGHPASVRQTGAISFKQTYCYSANNCTTTTSAITNIGTYGVGASFALPTGTLTSLKQDLQYNVTKTNSGTLYRQYAYADYSHATSTISQGNATLYSVDTGGIDLDTSIYNYYDSIGTAMASWNGTW